MSGGFWGQSQNVPGGFGHRHSHHCKCPGPLLRGRLPSTRFSWELPAATTASTRWRPPAPRACSTPPPKGSHKGQFMIIAGASCMSFLEIRTLGCNICIEGHFAKKYGGEIRPNAYLLQSWPMDGLARACVSTSCGVAVLSCPSIRLEDVD